MANLTIKYEDGSSQEWNLTEREADVIEFHVERLFGLPRLRTSKGFNAKEANRFKI